ncbi:ATP-binding protein [Spirillospora sp. CA-253888]
MTAPAPWTRRVARTAAFALVYLAAVWAGRRTIVDAADLSLVWPAAGVAVVWLLTVPRGRGRAADLAVLAAAGTAVDLATGVPLAAAGAFTAANLAQIIVFLAVSDRVCPHLTRAGRAPFARPADLRGPLIAIAAGVGAGTAVVLSLPHLPGDLCSWYAAAVWPARNAAGILLVGTAGLCLRHALAGRRARDLAAAVRARAGRDRCWAAERLALAAVSAAAYCAVFGNSGLPLTFLLLTVTVWAAMRCGVAFVAGHSLAVGTVAVTFTLHGAGPLAAVGSSPLRALLVQLFVAIVAFVGLVLVLSRAEREELTRRATAAQREACAQARTLSTIMDSMREGVGVLDSGGRLLVRNPAALELLDAQDCTGEVRWPGRYSLFHPDGRPLAAEETAHARALAGEEVRDEEVLVRSATMPEGRVLSVSAAPLAGDGRERCAVVVFRDVTAERRHRDELAAFAGVVAHDLLNPLTTVDGWAQMTDELVDTGGSPHELHDGLARVRRAAGRMRHLINDLLAYTTARDAPLALTEVRLTDLVTDVVAAHADRPGRGAGDAPRFDIAELPVLHADPVLLRQLLDNVIGNALKYARPGVAPHIAVSAAAAGSGMVAVEVRDNGIGVPAGQHESVFDNFHRAHRGSGRGGTGLGLAICKRIAERHGGTITAADNPGGAPGTRIVFTLPAAPQDAGRPRPALRAYSTVSG